MKILFTEPNTIAAQQNFYHYVRFLRKKNIDACLLFNTNFKIDDFYLHSRQDLFREMSSHPAYVGKEFQSPFYFLKHPIGYFAKQRELLDFMREYDLIICAGIAPIWVWRAGKPFVFLSHGSDLDHLAVYGTKLPIPSNLKSKDRLKNFLLKHYLQTSLKRAKAIVVAPYQIPTAKKLGLKNLKFLPQVIDTEFFKPMDHKEKKELRDALKSKLGCELIFFHPSRQMWQFEQVPNRKGNDRLFKAFAKFIELTNKEVKLIAIEWGADVEGSKRLIRKCGIEDKVIWEALVKRAKLPYYYNIADIVFDQFATGILALVAVEAMSCSAATFSYVKPSPSGMFYPEMPPIVNVSSEEDILRCLCELANDESARERLGEKSREWIMKYCHWESAIQEHIEFYKEVLKGW